MHALRCLAVALALLALAVPAAAQDVPASAVQGFFAAVSGGRYPEAWALLSTPSQEWIITEVARDEKQDPATVRELFQTTDPAVQKGFWDSFRQSSQAAALAAQSYTTASTTGNTATVTAAGLDVPFQVVLEGGAWRFGLIETFPPGQ